MGVRNEKSKRDEIMSYYNIPDEPHIAEQHTGITGAMLNVRIYQTLIRYRKEHHNLNFQH